METLSKRRLFTCTLGSVSVICFSLFIVPMCIQRRSHLLTTPVFSLAEVGLYGGEYAWLTNTSVLLQHSGYFETMDINTQKRKRLARLSAFRSRDPMRDLAISGDGQWLVWKGNNGNVVFMDIDEHTSYQIKMGLVEYHWIGKSHQLLVCYMTVDVSPTRNYKVSQALSANKVSKAAVYDVDRKQQEWLTIPSPSALTLGWDSIVTNEQHLIFERDSDLAMGQKTSSPTMLNIQDYVIRPSVRRITKRSVPMPHDGFTSEIKLSPDGSKVAYTTEVVEDLWPQKLLKRVLQNVRDRSATDTLVICNSQGEILEKDTVTHDVFDHGIEGVRWLPDGAGVSFAYQEKVYCLKVR